MSANPYDFRALAVVERRLVARSPGLALRVTLDDGEIEQIAQRAADLVFERLQLPSAPGEWLTTNEASVYLGLTPNALHKLSSARQIPFSQDKPGGRLFFRRADLDAWRASQAHGPVL